MILNIKVKSTFLPSFAFLCSSLSFCNDFSNLDLCSYTTGKKFCRQLILKVVCTKPTTHLQHTQRALAHNVPGKCKWDEVTGERTVSIIWDSNFCSFLHARILGYLHCINIDCDNPVICLWRQSAMVCLCESYQILLPS